MVNRNSREEEEEEESSGDDRQHQPVQQTFLDNDGYPLCFFIHKSVRKPGARVKLADDIEVGYCSQVNYIHDHNFKLETQRLCG